MISQRVERWISILMVAAFFALALGFSTGPILEGFDEYPHYQFIRALIAERGLPDVTSQPRGGQYHQAPLYYVMAAPLVMIANDSDFDAVNGRANPFFGHAFSVPGNDNKNVLLHTRAEAFPYTGSGTALAVHLVRLMSVVMGTGTVIASACIFRLLWPDRPDLRLAALGVVSFWPQFIYLSSLVNNDNLLILLAAVSLLLILRQLRDGPTWRGAILLGAVLGAALLAKASALLLAIPVGAAVLLDFKRSWRYAALTLAITLAIAGWWYVRNFALYGDFTGLGNQLAEWGFAITPAQGLTWERMRSVYATLWARFGYEVVAVGPPFSIVFDALSILGLIGAIFVSVTGIRRWKSVKISQRQSAIIVATYGLTWLAGTIYVMATADGGARGRYLLIGIPALGALIAYGLSAVTPARLRVQTALTSTALLAAVAMACLFGIYLPAYRPTRVAPNYEPSLLIRYGDAAELIGIEPATVHARPGETVRIQLVWRALGPTETSLYVDLHSVGGNVVFRDSLPATGNLLSTDWLPGQMWAEDYVVIIPASTPEQAVYPLIAGLYNPVSGDAPAPRNATGEEVFPRVGRIAINGPQQPFTPDYTFAEVIGLAEPEVTRRGDSVTVCLRWVSLAETSMDYHVFIHLLEEDGDLAAQSDSQPKGGAYQTDVWTPGEVIAECLTLDAPGLPESGWHVAVGMYTLPDGARAEVVDSRGEALPDNMVIALPAP